MTHKTHDSSKESTAAIHQYYMDILNCMPNIVYWIDVNCVLKGCNHNFVQLLGLKNLQDFNGTPYEQLIKFADWPTQRMEKFQLDDMAVIFSGKAHYNVDELPIINKKQQPLHFQVTRVPLFDKQHQVIGLVVILIDKQAKNLTDPQPLIQPDHKPAKKSHLVKVLMVEDNYIAQKVEQALLVELGCEVDIADSGEMACQLFTPEKYHLILMDIGLQDTSGYIVAKNIREKEKNNNSHVPIIALTSYKADIVKYDCSDYFMDGVITKPLTHEQAKQIIQRFVYHEDVVVMGLHSGV